MTCCYLVYQFVPVFPLSTFHILTAHVLSCLEKNRSSVDIGTALFAGKIYPNESLRTSAKSFCSLIIPTTPACATDPIGSLLSWVNLRPFRSVLQFAPVPPSQAPVS